MSNRRHVLYSIAINAPEMDQQWTVSRRYSQFLTLRDTLISTFDNAYGKCPGCDSFFMCLKAFDFPQKQWIHSDRVIRSRVKALERFIHVTTTRTFNKAPKCHTCGVSIAQIMRSFLLRGAKPLADSNIRAIRAALVVCPSNDHHRYLDLSCASSKCTTQSSSIGSN